jgi:hypothetical protein
LAFPPLHWPSNAASFIAPKSLAQLREAQHLSQRLAGRTACVGE